MKKITYSILVAILILTIACKGDDDHQFTKQVTNICEDCEVCEECPEELGYKNVQVDFFSTHKGFEVKLRVFETVTEQVLVREAHLEGALFETNTEQYLVKESFTRYRILDSQEIHIVANSETDSVAEIVCYHFFEEADFEAAEVPAEYSTRTYFTVALQGTGAEVPAEYATIVRKILVSDSEIIPNTEEQLFNRVGFRIPEEETIQLYLAEQFAQQGVEECGEGNGFKVVE